jgi:predicted transglutaminase-like cysteine proteinase
MEDNMAIFKKQKPTTHTEEILKRMQKQQQAMPKKSGGLRGWLLVACTAAGIYTQREEIAQYVDAQKTAITKELKNTIKEKTGGYIDFTKENKEPTAQPVPKAPIVPAAKSQKQNPPQATTPELPKQNPPQAATPMVPKVLPAPQKPAPIFQENVSQISIFNQIAQRIGDNGVITKRNVNISFSTADDWYAMMGRSEKLMSNPENKKIWNSWIARFASIRNADLQTKLRMVDQIVDEEIRYESDSYTMGRSEYFSSPIEILKLKQGDCDDFAILKYMTLKALGVNESSMYMLSVDWEGRGQVDHAILSVSLDGKSPTASSNVVLLNNDGEGLLIPTSERRSTIPYMAMNSKQGLYAFPALYNSIRIR